MLAKGSWEDVKSLVGKIAETENSYMYTKDAQLPSHTRFAPNGLSQLGSKTHFPPTFINELIADGHGALADQIMAAKCDDYFLNDRHNALLFREFGFGHKEPMIHGVLTDRYSVFDDKEVVNILESSDYLMGAGQIWYDVTPDQFHARFISSEKLYIGGDTSPLSMCVFVDNSMVGKSMLKIRFGLYRWACTNGVISDFKEFCILRERHVGTEKDWTRIVAESLIDVKRYEQMLLDKVKDMSITKSAIYDMTEEDAERYIRDKLTTSKKKAREIIECYNTVYGAFSKWDLCNAITEVAHNVETLDTRLLFEQRAMKVA